MDRHVTLRDVAAKAGVSLFTASCAVRNLARVAPATRDRVRRTAQALGYHPDPSAVALSARQHRTGGRGSPFDLALLVWRHGESFFAEFQQACSERGYGARMVRIESFPSVPEASRGLWHQGVQGVLFNGEGVWTMPRNLDGFDWRRFAVVKLTRSVPGLRFDHVRHSDFSYATVVLREAFARGARRVAVLLTRSSSPVDDDARVGAVLAWKALHLRRGCRLDWRQMDGVKATPEIKRWLRSLKPDTVVGFPWSWHDKLQAAGWRIPRDIRFAGMIAPDSPALPIAGCAERNADMVREGVNALHRLILEGARGFASQPRQTVIEPVWRDGASFPAATPR